MNQSSLNIGIPTKGIRQKYLKHKIFSTLGDLSEFYDFVSIHDDTTTIMVAKGFVNYNYEIYQSISNTLDSIGQLLKLGRINDAFALIRKFNDALMIHVYSMVLAEKEEENLFNDDYSLYDNLVNKWVNGSNRLMEGDEEKEKMKSLLQVISARDRYLGKILFNKKNRSSYGNKRNTANDNLHYNTWNTFRLNDSKIMDYEISLQLLSEANSLIVQLFSIHFSYLTLIKPTIMLSYENKIPLDDGTFDDCHRDCAASFVCELFEKYVATFDKTLADYLANCTFLRLRY